MGPRGRVRRAPVLRAGRPPAGGAKLVLVGVPYQLPPIEAGGLFPTLIDRLGAVELTVNSRQREAWEREALDELRNGDPDKALAAYVEHDRIITAETPEEVRVEAAAWSARPRCGRARRGSRRGGRRR